jgi:protein-tyrosine phosphatase
MVAGSRRSPARQISLDGCFNFRDLGGHRTNDGLDVRWRVLFRADGLHRLSEGDLDQLGRLGVTTVIDLRTTEELTTRGRVGSIQGLTAFHHLPLFEELPDLTVVEGWDDPITLGRHYADMAETGAASIAEALTVLSHGASYPAVFHCTAGKDRTGVLAAVVLGLLGVPDDVIADDYAATAPAMGHMLAWLLETYPDGRDEIERRAATMLACRPEAIHEFLAHVRAKYGTIDGFATAIGLPTAGVDLRALLLTESLAA